MNWHLTAAAAVTVLILSVGYTASCIWWPFAKCTKCEGKGRFSRTDGKVWRDCRRCKGSGRRLRVGRWVFNKIRARHNAAS